MSAKELEAAQKELDAVIKKNPQGEVHDAAVKARATIVVLLEEKKLVEEAKAVQEAKEAAEVTVRTKYDHEAGQAPETVQGAEYCTQALPGKGRL